MPRLRLRFTYAGDRASCAVIAFQCFAVQLFAVQRIPIRFTQLLEICLCNLLSKPLPLLIRTFCATEAFQAGIAFNILPLQNA